MKIIVTARPDTVIGYHGVTNYYGPVLERDRLRLPSELDGFEQIEGMSKDSAALSASLIGSEATWRHKPVCATASRFPKAIFKVQRGGHSPWRQD